jgi:hypothetical protein
MAALWAMDVEVVVDDRREVTQSIEQFATSP